MLLILVGVTLTALTVVIHVTGATSWVLYLADRYRDTDGLWRRRSVLGVMVSTSVVMLLLHVVEVWLWAAAYRVVTPGELETLEEALYFSFVTFTSLGYGDITLSSEWPVTPADHRWRVNDYANCRTADCCMSYAGATARRTWRSSHWS